MKLPPVRSISRALVSAVQTQVHSLKHGEFLRSGQLANPTILQGNKVIMSTLWSFWRLQFVVVLNCVVLRGVWHHRYKWDEHYHDKHCTKHKPFHITGHLSHNILIWYLLSFTWTKSFAVHGTICSFNVISINTKRRGREQQKFTEWKLNKHGITAAEQNEIILKKCSAFPNPHMMLKKCVVDETVCCLCHTLATQQTRASFSGRKRLFQTTLHALFTARHSEVSCNALLWCCVSEQN